MGRAISVDVVDRVAFTVMSKSLNATIIASVILERLFFRMSWVTLNDGLAEEESFSKRRIQQSTINNHTILVWF